MTGARVISFSSGKGGVGKTTLVANLGTLLAATGKKVLLIDGDWSLGKLSITLGVRPAWTVDQVLAGEIALSSAIQKVSPNLFLLASPSGVIGFEELSEAARNQIYFELEGVAEEYDLVLFDHSSGVHWGVLQFVAASHHHVIVTTPDPTSYTDAYAIMKILNKRFAIRDFQLLVTMSDSRKETESVIERFNEVVRTNLGVRISLLDIIPRDIRISESVRRQKVFVATHPTGELSDQFREMSRRLTSIEMSNRHGLNFSIRAKPELDNQRDDLCQV